MGTPLTRRLNKPSADAEGDDPLEPLTGADAEEANDHESPPPSAAATPHTGSAASNLADGSGSGAKGKPNSEWDKMLLLVVLYTLQGVPLGLCMGSVPFLLQEAKASLTDIGFFGLASWPFSLKLLWSPIVDSVFSSRFGRRKSWIVPMQFAIGLVLLYLSSRVDEWLAPATLNVRGLSVAFFTLVMCAATQDIAVDGWTISLLSRENQAYGSTCQSVGQNIGFFLSYSVFLALGNPSFSNYFRSTPSEVGLLSLSGYLFFWGVFFLCVTCFLFLKREAPFVPSASDPADDGLRATYLKIWRITKLPHMRSFILILLTHKFAFQATEGLAVLKLTEKGFPKETLAALVFVMFPLELVYPIVVARVNKQHNSPMKPFLVGYPFRLLMCLVTTALVWWFPTHTASGDSASAASAASAALSWGEIGRVVGIQVVYDFSMTLMFVSMNVFFTSISDDSFGGSYMTFLNTLTNLGGTWPRLLVFAVADRLTCPAAAVTGAAGAAGAANTPAADTAASPAAPVGCAYVAPGFDGFYIVSLACIAVGLLWYAVFWRRVLALDRVDRRDWRLAPAAAAATPAPSAAAPCDSSAIPLSNR